MTGLSVQLRRRLYTGDGSLLDGRACNCQHCARKILVTICKKRIENQGISPHLLALTAPISTPGTVEAPDLLEVIGNGSFGEVI